MSDEGSTAASRPPKGRLGEGHREGAGGPLRPKRLCRLERRQVDAVFDAVFAPLSVRFRRGRNRGKPHGDALSEHRRQAGPIRNGENGQNRGSIAPCLTAARALCIAGFRYHDERDGN